MDRQALIADLRQARCNVDDAGRHLTCMIIALERGDDMPKWERSHAAEKLNRASEYVRRAYDG